MSEASYEVIDSEIYDGDGESFGDAYDWEGEGESYDGEGESYGENSRARARAYRRARHQQIVQARQRDAARRGMPRRPGPRPAPPAARPSPTTINAIRAVDLDAKVSRDSMRRAIELANRRASRATYSAVAGVAVNQALDTFSESLEEHPFVRAALRWAPLAVLPTNENLRGAQKYLLHPATVGFGIIGAVAVVGQLTNRSHRVFSIEIAKPGSIANNSSGRLFAQAFDRDGNEVTDQVVWTSLDSAKLEFTNPATGAFTAKAVGEVLVEVRVGGRTKPLFVEVK